MSDLNTHNRHCLQELGEEFRHVHEWLDEGFKYLGPEHREIRHNRRGVEEVRRRWGTKQQELRRFILKRMMNKEYW